MKKAPPTSSVMKGLISQAYHNDGIHLVGALKMRDRKVRRGLVAPPLIKVVQS